MTKFGQFEIEIVLFTVYHMIPGFKDLEGEKEQMLVTSTSSFSCNVFERFIYFFF